MTEKPLFIRACVIANGVEDLQHDIITKEDIKRIFINSEDVGYDTNHDNIRKQGIYLQEQYITKEEETLGNHSIPTGSWMVVLKITNPEIQEKIEKKELRGVSITAHPEREALDGIKRSNPKLLLYKDIVQKEKIHPKEISLVKSPSNNLPFEIMDYDTYISKSIEEGEIMTEIQNEDKNIENISNEDSQTIIKKLVDVLHQVVPSVSKEQIQPENEEVVEKEDTEGEGGITAESEENSEKEETDESIEEVEEEEKVEKGEKEEESEESEAEESEEIEKMIPQAQAQTGGAEQALIQIAQICTQYLQATQQQQPPQQQAQQQNIMHSTNPPEEESIKKEDVKVVKKQTSKYDGITESHEVDRAMAFAIQTGRDPLTGERLYN